MPYVDDLYYEEAGEGHPVILIHCPALSHCYWRPVMDRLASSCRCIAIDIRGHGQSGRGERPWSFKQIGHDIALLSRVLALHQPVLVGYSAGGAIALRSALDHPGRYGGLVVVSGFSECSTLTMKVKVGLGLGAVNLGLVGMIGPNIIGTNSVGPEHTQAMLPDARHVSPVSLRAFFRESLRFNITDRLGEIKEPVLLVYGSADRWMHCYYRILQERLPNAQVLLVDGVDHRVPTRRPDDFADAVAAFVAAHATPDVGPPVPRVEPPFRHPGPSQPQLHP